MSEAKKWIILTDPEALEHFGHYVLPVCQLGNVDIFNADGSDAASDDAEDARLIARAPDMDAALREAVEAMERVEQMQKNREKVPSFVYLTAVEGALTSLSSTLARCRAALGEG